MSIFTKLGGTSALISLLLVSGGVAVAAPQQSEGIGVEQKVKLCALVQEYALAVINARQGGVPVAEAMVTFNGNHVTYELAKKAYRSPTSTNEELKAMYVQEFVDERVSACLLDPLSVIYIRQGR